MADMNGGQDEPRFKLFGTTIALQVKEESNKEDQEEEEEKKPEKIIPCPRCKSMETKFCYFNNYNVNQPRHFCKGCQRYWTAGGALRNVPVGAGRRKAKPLGHEMMMPMFDTPGMHRFDLDGVGEEWHIVAQGGQPHVFHEAKRRRSSSGGRIC